MIDQELFKQHSPELYNIGRQLAESYRTEIRKADAVGSGTLVNFKWDIALDSKGLVLQFFLPDYWRQIEFGRRPTQKKGDGTMRKKIEEWIKDKGIVGNVRYDKKGRAYTPTPKQLSYLIARKIHQKGYDPRHPLEYAMTNSTQLQQQFVDTAAKIFTDQVKDMIVQINTTK